MDSHNHEAEVRESEVRQVKKSRKNIIILVIIMLVACGMVGAMIFMFLYRATEEEEGSGEDPHTSIISQDGENVKDKQFYSPLTGLPVADEAAVSAATFCVQIPNGLDGARPQAGLDKAGVIFEAIAERGITRFAAIYQNVDDIVAIGPMRSLRIYYLDWDVPFDCTIVHDGGSYEATVAARSYRDFTNFTYNVWRSSANSKLYRAWNNEFTSGKYLLAYNDERGYGRNSNVSGFTRETPEEAVKTRINAQAKNPLDIDKGTDESTAEVAPQVTQIRLAFGNDDTYNPTYSYDAATNTYPRAYAYGEAMTTYDCSGQSGEVTPEVACQPVQVAPAVVVAMVVEEQLDWDGYHESIKTLSEGTAHIFQNGLHYEGVWRKGSREEQIRFYDAEGKEIVLAPGQTIISAIPQYGSVNWE